MVRALARDPVVPSVDAPEEPKVGDAREEETVALEVPELAAFVLERAGDDGGQHDPDVW